MPGGDMDTLKQLGYDAFRRPKRNSVIVLLHQKMLREKYT
jgi:hypothetical protein